MGRETAPLSFQRITHWGACGKTPVVCPESPAEARTYGEWEQHVPVLLATYDSRGDIETRVGIGVRLRGLGAGLRLCPPPDRAGPAEVGLPEAQGRDVLVATGVNPSGL